MFANQLLYLYASSIKFIKYLRIYVIHEEIYGLEANYYEEN